MDIIKMEQQKKKEVLFVDDHAGMSLGVSTYLEKQQPDFNVSSFTEGLKALEQVEKRKFDAYIIDIELQDIGGMELIKLIRETDKTARIIIYTQHQGVWDIMNFREAKVDAIVIKGRDLQPLEEALLSVFENKKYQCSQFKSISVPNTSMNPDAHLLDENIDLDNSKIEIIQMLAQGLSYKEIAKATPYSEKSIPKIKDRLFKKFSVNTVSELVTKLFKNGFPVDSRMRKKKGY